MTHYATAEVKYAPLYGDFAKEFVARRFGADVAGAIYAALPTYGNPGTNGYVMTPGTHKVQIVLDLNATNMTLSEGFYSESMTAEQKIAMAVDAIGQMAAAVKGARRY